MYVCKCDWGISLQALAPHYYLTFRCYLCRKLNVSNWRGYNGRWWDVQFCGVAWTTSIGTIQWNVWIVVWRMAAASIVRFKNAFHDVVPRFVVHSTSSNYTLHVITLDLCIFLKMNFRHKHIWVPHNFAGPIFVAKYSSRNCSATVWSKRYCCILDKGCPCSAFTILKFDEMLFFRGCAEMFSKISTRFGTIQAFYEFTIDLHKVQYRIVVWYVTSNMFSIIRVLISSNNCQCVHSLLSHNFKLLQRPRI